MSRSRFRAVPLYINGKKVAEVTKGKLSLASGDEMQIGTDGYLGHSDGAMTSKLNPTCIIPVGGMTTTALRDALFNKKYLTAGLPVDGKFMQVDMRVVSGDFDWDWKTGTITGDYSLEGGEPTQV